MYSASQCKNPFTCAGRQNTPSRGRQYRAQNGKLRNLGTDLSPWYRACTKEICTPKGSYGYGETRNVFRQSVQLPHLPVRALKIPRLEGGSIGPRTESCVILGWTYLHGAVLAPRKYVHQKEATGMERPEMYSASRCNYPTYLCGPSKYPVSREAV